MRHPVCQTEQLLCYLSLQHTDGHFWTAQLLFCKLIEYVSIYNLYMSSTGLVSLETWLMQWDTHVKY